MDYVKITVEQQKEFLINAQNSYLEAPTDQIIKRAYFEENGKIRDIRLEEFKSTINVIGYCKTSKCKAETLKGNIIHSADFGTYVRYHCIDCLARILVNSRDTCSGPSVLIEFDTPIDKETGEIGVVNKDFHPEIRYNENDKKFYVNTMEADAEWTDLSPEDKIDDNFINRKLLIHSKFNIESLGQKHYLIGTYEQKCPVDICAKIYMLVNTAYLQKKIMFPQRSCKNLFHLDIPAGEKII